MEIVTELVDFWVELHTGEVLRLRASAFTEEEGHYVFDTLARGSPHVLVPLAYIPTSIVAEITSG